MHKNPPLLSPCKAEVVYVQTLAKENHRTPGKNYNTKNNKAIERGTRNAYTTTLCFSSPNIANFITHAKNETRPRSSDNSIPVHNRAVSQTVHETSKIPHSLRLTDHLFYHHETKSAPLSRQRIIRASTTRTSTYATHLCTTKHNDFYRTSGRASNRGVLPHIEVLCLRKENESFAAHSHFYRPLS